MRLAAGTVKFGLLFMAKMYFVPYWINVMWLDVVTYLHHTDKEVRMVGGLRWRSIMAISQVRHFS